MTMRSNKFLLLLTISCALLVCFFVKKYFFKSWTPYYQAKLYKEPSPLLVKALALGNDFSAQEKKALDLGAGAGNETAFLLKSGWRVWAEDAEPEAIKIIVMRNDIAPYKNNLVLIKKSFVDVPWDQLPQFDLIFAGYSLPFASQKDFFKIWQHIINALPAGGLFVGNFFGPEHKGFNWWTKRKMTFVTKEQLLTMLKDFKVELFEEFYGKDDAGIFEHSFNVIARKF